MNYNQSAIARIGDIHRGIMVNTGTLANATYMAQAQKSLFTVVGRVQIVLLMGEAVTVFDSVATTLQFNFTQTTPAVAVAALCGLSASLSGLAQGGHITCPGTSAATAAVIASAAGIAFPPTTSLNIGTIGGAGTIGILTGTASQTTGTCLFTCCYFPLSDGAYVSALV